MKQHFQFLSFGSHRQQLGEFEGGNLLGGRAAKRRRVLSVGAGKGEGTPACLGLQVKQPIEAQGFVALRRNVSGDFVEVASAQQFYTRPEHPYSRMLHDSIA